MGGTAIAFGVVMLIRAFSGDGWGGALLGIANVVIGLVLLLDPFGAALGLPLWSVP